MSAFRIRWPTNSAWWELEDRSRRVAAEELSRPSFASSSPMSTSPRLQPSFFPSARREARFWTCSLSRPGTWTLASSSAKVLAKRQQHRNHHITSHGYSLPSVPFGEIFILDIFPPWLRIQNGRLFHVSQYWRQEADLEDIPRQFIPPSSILLEIGDACAVTQAHERYDTSRQGKGSRLFQKILDRPVARRGILGNKITYTADSCRMKPPGWATSLMSGLSAPALLVFDAPTFCSDMASG